MPCYRPIQAWRSRDVNPTGKRSLVFKRTAGYQDLAVDVPCGQCIGCRLERSRQWAIRCVHEASLHDENCFLTLTYDDEHLPSDGSIDVVHYQKFMKRLRKKYPSRKIRFFHCGEYGEKGNRPHYHAILFNFDFPDKELFKMAGDNRLYTSRILENLWGMGHCIIGDVTFQSAAYVARYITKKVTGSDAESHYQGRKPEYITMSRRPGIGSDWFKKYKSDVYPGDFVVINGKKVHPPKFYDNLLSDDENMRYKALRKANAELHAENNTERRLRVRETVKESKAAQLKRSLEND